MSASTSDRMDVFTLVGTLYCSYILIWFIIACIADCDVITFLSLHFGKSPGKFHVSKSSQEVNRIFLAQEFAGKVVWITGASSGIGEALAKNLAQCDAQIAISARRKDELFRVKKECLGKCFRKLTVTHFMTDVTYSIESKIERQRHPSSRLRYVGLFSPRNKFQKSRKSFW